MMRTTWMMSAAMAVAYSAAMAGEIPKPGPLDPRIRQIVYKPMEVVGIVGWLNNTIQIEFGPGEDIAQVAIGNTVAWEPMAEGNILFLKPREAHPMTNMQVVTTMKDGTKRSYQMELMTVQGEAKKTLKPFFLVKYEYPTDVEVKRKAEAAAAAASKAEVEKAGQADKVLTAAEVNGPRNWAYTAQGEVSFEPLSVFDNGKITTLVFNQNMTIPAVYIVNRDGSESLVPKNLSRSSLMVHAVAEKLILRAGDEVLCLFNEGYVAGGIATGTMTVSPQVERVVKQTHARGWSPAVNTALVQSAKPN
jgi:type IV secretion system protein VirB9